MQKRGLAATTKIVKKGSGMLNCDKCGRKLEMGEDFLTVVLGRIAEDSLKMYSPVDAPVSCIECHSLVMGEPQLGNALRELQEHLEENR